MKVVRILGYCVLGLIAIFAVLRTLAPVHHRVDNSGPPVWRGADKTKLTRVKRILDVYARDGIPGIYTLAPREPECYSLRLGDVVS
jgi:hypothetical protein